MYQKINRINVTAVFFSWVQFKSKSLVISQAKTKILVNCQSSRKFDFFRKWARIHAVGRKVLLFSIRGCMKLLINVLEQWSRPRYQLRRQKAVADTLIQQIFAWQALKGCCAAFSNWKAWMHDFRANESQVCTYLPSMQAFEFDARSDEFNNLAEQSCQHCAVYIKFESV